MKLAFKYTKELTAFVQTVDEALTTNPMHHWKYASDKWNTELIREENLEIIESTTNKSGVYAIFVDTDLVYLGETQSTGSKAHFHAHFIAKDPRTGSKLELIKQAVAQKQKIGFSFIEIDPAELRHLIEEKLLKTHSPIWNMKGLPKAQLPKKVKGATAAQQPKSLIGVATEQPRRTMRDATMEQPRRTMRDTTTEQPRRPMRGATSAQPPKTMRGAPSAQPPKKGFKR